MGTSNSEIPSVQDLIGRDLKDWKIVEMTEVYRVDEDGLKTRSIGLFRDENIAKAFAGQQKDAPWHRTGPAVVITDGEWAWRLTEPTPILNDEQAALEIRERALEKLSPAERAVLKV